MYLFQPIISLISIFTPSIYIPLCIYFNEDSQNIFTFVSKFTFHYVSISTFIIDMVLRRKSYLHSTMYLFQRNNFNFNTFRSFNLHSTMYLFQQWRYLRFRRRSFIYIPLCIYFNRKCSNYAHTVNLIYIPLCIYFNRLLL